MKPNVLPKQFPSMAKKRRYDDTYLNCGFTCTAVGNEERPQCVLCLKALACDSLKPNKLRDTWRQNIQSTKTSQLSFSDKNCCAQQSFFTKAASVPISPHIKPPTEWRSVKSGLCCPVLWTWFQLCWMQPAL